MKILSIALLTILVTGCISLPKTEQELKTNNYKVESQCVDIEFVKAYETIAINTARCHGSSDGAIVPAAGSYLSISTEDQITGFITSDKSFAKISVEHINPVAGGFLQLIELEKTDSCPTYVSVYLLNDSTKWQTATDSVFKWLKGNKESCFELM